MQQELAALKLQQYEIEAFSTPHPEINRVRIVLTEKARRAIKSILFWTVKKKRNEYVERNLQPEYDKEVEQWLSEKNAFEKAEREKQEQETKRLFEEFEARKNELEDCLSGAERYVQSQIDSFLKSLTLPVEFSVNYEYSQEKGHLMVDLDIPEIEDLPKDKANILASGKLSIKPKTQKESKEDYVRCVIGLAFFFAGSFFNTSTSINKILVSAYTQRLSKKSGAVEDQYVYSVIFDRSQFASLSIPNIEPIEAVANFRHVFEATKTFEMKTIMPLAEVDL